MYTLADYIGEDKVNLALHNFLMQYRYANANDSQSGPYPDTRQFVDALRAQTPPELQYYITDAFENIVLYDNKAVSATVTPTAGPQIQSHADRAGPQAPVRRQRQRIAHAAPRPDRHRRLHRQEGRRKAALSARRSGSPQPTQTFEIVVDQPPTRAGIDPYNKLIDRDSDDNWIDVTR